MFPFYLAPTLILLRQTNSTQSLTDHKRPNICNKDDTNNRTGTLPQVELKQVSC